MNETILTSDDGNYRVVASAEHEAENPRWGAEFGLMYCRHPRYDLGDEKVGVLADLETIFHQGGITPALDWLVAEHGTTVILPLYLYDHSGLTITAGENLLTIEDMSSDRRFGDRWDTSLVGCIFDTAANRLDWVGNTEEILRAEVEEYDLFLRGEVYALTVEVKVTEARRSAFSYPDKAVVRDSVHVHWERVDETDYVTTYGSDDHQTIAANMLSDFISHPTV